MGDVQGRCKPESAADRAGTRVPRRPPPYDKQQPGLRPSLPPSPRGRIMQRIRAVLVLIVCSAASRPATGPPGAARPARASATILPSPSPGGLTATSGGRCPWSTPATRRPSSGSDRIFLTQANKDGTVRSLLCLGRADGKQLWQKDVAYPHKERNWGGITYTNASPATDGERVVVSFASAGMYCYDLDGRELWKRTDLGHWEHAFGSGSSPVLYGRLAYPLVRPRRAAAPRRERQGRRRPQGQGQEGGTRPEFPDRRG